MPTYVVKHPDGRTLEISGPTPPTQSQLDEIFAAAGGSQKPAPMRARGFTDPNSVKVAEPPAWNQPGGDVLLDNVRSLAGVVRGAGKELVAQGMRGGAKLRQLPGVNAVANALPSVPVGNMAPTNTPERLGQSALNLLEYIQAGKMAGAMPGGLLAQSATGAGLNAGMAQAQGAGPVGTTAAAIGGAVAPALQAIPTRAKAAKKFQEVMGATKDVPVDIQGPGNAALRIQELADRGGSMPMAVRKFLLRITDPEKGALTYGEARDFYSNISRLSANETQRLTPVVAKELNAMRVALDAANESAASEVGKAAVYRAAMKEYRRASLGREAVKKGLKYGAGAIGAGAVYKMFGTKAGKP